MHGGSFMRELAPRFYRALQEKPFAYRGLLQPTAGDDGSVVR